MSAIVIYGDAVQEARNRIRSMQVSVMFKTLDRMTFAEGKQHAALLANAILSPQLQAENPGAAVNLERARDRIRNFYSNDYVQEVFALGDAIRDLGEYIENGGAGAAVKEFENNLRNKPAFDKSSNRARQEAAGYALSEWPPLGIFKNRLLDRSVVKYMERFYGPYIGADISGTTTDGLAVLALLQTVIDGGGRLAEQAQAQAALGWELPPIATMVLQYHHSLLECGLALALKNSAVQSGQDAPVLGKFDYYDLSTLADSRVFSPVLKVGTSVLKRELAGRRLVVLRDAIDIQSSPYADCEVALLVDGADAVFDIGAQYEVFAGLRKVQVMSGDGVYRNGDPSLLQVAEYYAADLDVPPLHGDAAAARSLAKMNSAELKGLPGLAFDNLDRALATLRPPPPVGAQAEPAPPVLAAPPASGADADPDSENSADGQGAAVPDAGNDLLSRLSGMQPAQLAALRRLLSN
ncbi:hypothetical protein [Xanthomonas medicagonis]|uniref:hypothetical protein n=1 Tax=Xanthomonas medicagonis TaxID=3160841 RepID=UPI0035178539